MTNTIQSGAERAIQKTAQGGINKNLMNAMQVAQVNPQQMAKYQQALFDPQAEQINQTFDRLGGEANMAAAASGVGQGVGFGKFMTGEIGRGRAAELANARKNAYLSSFDLPNKQLEPLMNLGNLLQGSLTGQQAQVQANQNATLQGSTQGQLAKAPLAAYQEGRYTNALNAYNKPKQSGGFLSWMDPLGMM